jgi:hypothetical protein
MVVKVETTAANDTDDRMVVVKYAANGTIAWQKAVQFDANEGCRGADADIDADGNIYVCGNYDTEIGVAMSIVKFNSSGVKQWSRRIVGDCVDFATSVVVGPDNNLYLTGVTTTPDAETVTWVVAKYSTTGSVIWQRLIENTASWTFTGSIFFENAGGSNIAVSPDYVLLGGGFGTFENDEDPTATVVQIDTNGTLFSIGNWALTAASFTGNLDDSASDITVVNAGKADTDNAENITTSTATLTTEVSGFLIGTLYNAPGGDDSLVNGEYSVILGNTGTVTLPSGGTISEGVVTSNPTIQLTPASPDVASQKLVIKGGGGQYYITENGIDLGTNNNVWAVSDSATFYVYAPTRPNETLYWWIVPEGSGISTTMSGTVELGSEGEGVFNFTVISDAYEFRVRVSPEEDNYDPESIGVESVLINGDAPAYGDYHLHLTTGDLTETSIFLGTDDHNVRTTTDGKIQITTFVNSYTVNNVWEFGTDGDLTLPTGGHIGPSGGKGQGTTYGGANDHLVSLTSYYNSGLYSSCVTAYADGTLNITAYNDGGPNPAKIWTFDNTGTLTLPDNSGIKSSTNIDITIDTPDSSTFNWRFGADGDLTLPNGMTIDSSGDLGSNAFVRIGGNNTSISIDDNGAPPGIVMATDITGTGNYWLFSSDGTTLLPGDLELNSTGNIRSENAINININLSDSTLRRWTFGEDGDLTFPDNTVQTTAYTGITTVAKTGVPADTGIPVTLSGDMTGLGIADGTYGPFTKGGVTFEVTVSGGVGGTVTAGQNNINFVTTVTYGGETGIYPGGTSFLQFGVTSEPEVEPPTPEVLTAITTGATVQAYNESNALVTSTTATTIGTVFWFQGAGSFLIPVTWTNGSPFLGMMGGTKIEWTGAGGGSISGYINISSTTSYAVNDTIGQLTSEDLGDAPGQTTNINVDAVDQGFTDIDLSKSINKLTDGNYTLADGVEGQIMYIVRSPETISENVFVDVDNGDGDNPLRPFMTNGGFANIDNTGICTLIFTDGTWKQTGGLWD